MGTHARIGMMALAASLCGCAGDGGRMLPPADTLMLDSADDDGIDDDLDDDDDDGSEVLDLGDGSDGGLLPQKGCSGIDFLFVVDNSSSMAKQQERLLASFQGFITAIQSTIVDVTSYHVAVVTSDAYEYNAAGCRGLGDFVTVTGGDDAMGVSCEPFSGGRRFATDADDLAQKFPCMARVGTGGSAIERPVSAAIAALEPGKSCNAGFLRDDAILVVVIVTDDPPYVGDFDDAHLDAATAGWHDAIVAAKHGDEMASVVIGFVPWGDLSCLVYAVDSPNLIDFVDSFGDRGELASVCAADYTSVFATTVATIQTTCQEFTPAG